MKNLPHTKNPFIVTVMSTKDGVTKSTNVPNIWDLLLETGLFAAPFLAHIISSFLKVREQGDDEGNKGRLLIAWLENKIYTSITVMMLCCVPLFEVSFTTLKFNESRMAECKVTQISPEQTGLAGLKSELNGQAARLPVWWMFTVASSKGLTHGAIASIPCKPDLRQLRFEVQNTQIKDPFLRQEVGNFVQQCYLPARARFYEWGRKTGVSIDKAAADDLAWLGSHILRNKDGLYNRFWTDTANPHFPYAQYHRNGLNGTETGGGYPDCKSWWEADDIGLRARLISQFREDVKQQIAQTYSGLKPNDYYDSLIRQLIKQSDIDVSNGRIYSNYGHQRHRDTGHTDSNAIWDGLKYAGSAVREIGNFLASRIGSVATAPGFDMMKQSLSMMQGLIVFSITLVTPLLIVFSGYSVKAIMVMTFGWFAVYFLSFWWEIAHWIDTSLLDALYDSGAHSADGLNFIWNTADDGILNIVTNILYLLLPVLWIGFLSWTGINAGSAISSAIKSGSSAAQDTTMKGANTMTSVAKSTVK